MSYPFWDVGIGYGVLMAAIAIIHVFVSHFAIGGGLYLVVAETAARRARDTVRLDFLKRLSRFFVLVTLVFGALTGVGIWVIIGLLNPAATEVLIRHFVWAWATEWTFFTVEILAAIVYFYGWDTMSERRHLIVGWIYFGAAWLSLFAINGIIGFMLTPGEWLTTGSFWAGFFNPSFWPALVFRTGICILLAGVYTMAVASRARPDEAKGRLVRYNAIWALVGLIVVVPSAYWYWGAIPSAITTTAAEQMATPLQAIRVWLWTGAAVAAMVAVFGLAAPRRLHTVFAALLMLLSLGFFGGFEWARESIRKPYAIHAYMYGNGIAVADADLYAESGLLPAMTYRTGDDGADLFRRACRSCHTIDGYKPLKPVFDGTDPEFIAALIRGAVAIRGNMPPFLGTDEEASAIAHHIWSRVDQRPFDEIHGLTGVDLGKRVFDVRCGRCHEFGGYLDNYESVVGLEAEEYEELLDLSEDFDENMPPFTGDDAERAALIQYFQSLGEESAL